MVDFILYRAQANWYMRIIRMEDQAVYDSAAGAMSMGPSWADSVITLAWNSIIGGYEVDLPDVPAGGEYDITVL